MIHKCINQTCQKVIKNPRYIHCEEAVCKDCWDRLVPSHRKRAYQSMKRQIRYVEKQEIMNPLYRCAYWPQFAEQMTRIWAHLRKDIGVQPYHLAGFTSFYNEMNFSRQEPLTTQGIEG